MTLEEIERQLIVLKESIEDILKHIYQEGVTVTGGFPEPAPPKKARKPRRRKERDFPAPDNTTGTITVKDLKDADADHPFYGRKKREKKEPVEQ